MGFPVKWGLLRDKIMNHRAFIIANAAILFNPRVTLYLNLQSEC